jgi:hypothetical protein
MAHKPTIVPSPVNKEKQTEVSLKRLVQIVTDKSIKLGKSEADEKAK